VLFNSFGFLLVFFPICVLGFFGLARYFGHFSAACWLAIASIIFYGWWDYRYVPLLLASIAANYYCGFHIGRAERNSAKKFWLVIAVISNLALLAYYKYADFFLLSMNGLVGSEFQPLNIVLPIGISFFTFTQIAFLVDTYQGKVREYRFVHYVLFVTYFPHLIAGPVLHHKEMMPQFADMATYKAMAENFAVGLTIFFIGLAKKVLIADNLSPYANGLFDAPESPSCFIAWGGVLAYAFQLYFDFSGYSDMAIGLSRIFGIHLPLNFSSPYKAENISEFWRRWHMTLSRFLRDYLYVALGGNRHGRIRRYINLMLTMVLGGLWHGAGWNFAIWGGLHGAYLVINHAWAAFAQKMRLPVGTRLWRATATLLTFLAVCLAWVFFRAADLPTALRIVDGLIGLQGISLPDAIGNRLGQLAPLLEQAGISFFLGGGSRFIETWAWVGIAALIAFACPNTQEIMRHYRPALDYSPTHNSSTSGRMAWYPSSRVGIALGVLAALSLLALNRPSEFLYFQF